MALQPAMFPDIEGPEFLRDDAVAEVSRTVLSKHGKVGGPLFEVAKAIRDEEIHVLWLRNDREFDPNGEEVTHETAGKCIKASRLWHDVTGFHVAIWLLGYAWDRWTPEQQEAFVLHELLHVEIKRNKDLEAKVAVRKHDVEDFVDVVRLYGTVVGDSARYVRAATIKPAAES